MEGDLNEMFKMVSGLNNPNAIPSFEQVTNSSLTREHRYKLRRPISKTTLRHNRFTSGNVNDWNSLPDDVVESPTMNTFKNILVKYFEHDPIVFDPDI